jgi:hypothetical protein
LLAFIALLAAVWAAWAASRQAATAETSFATMERPYLFIASPPIVCKQDMADDSIRVGAELTIVNHGKTPAILNCHQMVWELYENLPVEPNYGTETWTSAQPIAVIPAGETYSMNRVSQELSEDWYRGGGVVANKLYLFGRLCYSDFTGRNYPLGFCYDISPAAGMASVSGGHEYNYYANPEVRKPRPWRPWQLRRLRITVGP